MTIQIRNVDAKIAVTFTADDLSMYDGQDAQENEDRASVAAELAGIMSDALNDDLSINDTWDAVERFIRPFDSWGFGDTACVDALQTIFERCFSKADCQRLFVEEGI